jgi:hypothetical protein
VISLSSGLQPCLQFNLSISQQNVVGVVGATFRTVWSHLQDEVAAQYGYADPAFKQAIWESLSAPDVTFMETVQVAATEDGVEAAGARKR